MHMPPLFLRRRLREGRLERDVAPLDGLGVVLFRFLALSSSRVGGRLFKSMRPHTFARCEAHRGHFEFESVRMVCAEFDAKSGQKIGTDVGGGVWKVPLGGDK